MNYPFSVYDPTTGRVLRSGVCSGWEDVQNQADLDEAVIPVKLDEETQYIVNGNPIARPMLDMPVEYAGDTTLDLPAGTKVRLNGENWQEAADGQVIIEPVEDTLVFVRPPWPYRQFKVLVRAD